MKKIILIRYGEIFLKGNNRRFFERLLEGNIKKAVEGCGGIVAAARTRYEVVADEAALDGIIARLHKISGISSISIAYKCASDLRKLRRRLCRSRPIAAPSA